MKRRVKFLEPIAGLADPNREALDRKYAKIKSEAEKKKLEAESKGERFSMGPTLRMIADMKIQDRYEDVCRGFRRDFGYKIGDEAQIPAEVAAQWVEQEICQYVEEPSKKAAA